MSRIKAKELQALLTEVRAFQICANLIPAPNPVVRASSSSRILIVGQAPGTKVHASGIPWDDASGKRLRDWMGVDSETFYDVERVSIVDLPPRPECAPKWHEQLLAHMTNVQCTLLIGQYAQKYYLEDSYKTLTERIEHWQEYTPGTYVLPHPSPRNQMWLRRNPWFEEKVVPQLKKTIRGLL